MNKTLTTLVIAVAAGIGGAWLYTKYIKKKCKCGEHTTMLPGAVSTPSLPSGTTQASATANEIANKTLPVSSPVTMAVEGWIDQNPGWGIGMG